MAEPKPQPKDIDIRRARIIGLAVKQFQNGKCYNDFYLASSDFYNNVEKEIRADERAKMFLALEGFDYGDYIIELDNGKVFDEKNFLKDLKEKVTK